MILRVGNRSRRRRRRTGPGTFDDTGGHSPYTFEGELHQLGSFASAAARRRGVLGWAGRAAVWFLLLLSLGGVVGLVVSVVNALRV